MKNNIYTVLTDIQSGHMRHALGQKPGKAGYRNHFCADPGSDDDECWADLARRGLADRFRTPSEILPYNTYRVTDAGREALARKEKP